MMALVVDDDRDIRESFGMILELSGFDVRTAEHGQAALELLHSGYTPDAILLDLMMPVLNGVEFLRIIRGDPRFADLRVVVSTAFGGMHRQLMAERLAVQALVEKPVDVGRPAPLRWTYDNAFRRQPRSGPRGVVVERWSTPRCGVTDSPKGPREQRRPQNRC